MYYIYSLLCTEKFDAGAWRGVILFVFETMRIFDEM
jgi:hypothetical protein